MAMFGPVMQGNARLAKLGIATPRFVGRSASELAKWSLVLSGPASAWQGWLGRSVFGVAWKVMFFSLTQQQLAHDRIEPEQPWCGDDADQHADQDAQQDTDNKVTH